MSFKKNKYTVIKQAISKDLAAFVANYFLMQKHVYDTCRQSRYFSPFETIIGYYEGENEQIPNTYSQYANMAMETLLLKCQPGMEKATGLKLYPAYTYARIYKKGGGHHSAHIHWNQHVSGFYFLKCSNKTSYPIFHEPKTGARCTKLKMKPNLKGVWAGHEQFHMKPKPGTLIIFPGYLEHEYAVDFGIEPFRFIHWNIQAVPKEMAKDV